MTQVRLDKPAPRVANLGSATSRPSMNASPEPSTMAATTQRARGNQNAIAGSGAGRRAEVVIL
jgi:hypothetical protein